MTSQLSLGPFDDFGCRETDLPGDLEPSLMVGLHVSRQHYMPKTVWKKFLVDSLLIGPEFTKIFAAQKILLKSELSAQVSSAHSDVPV